MSRFTTSGGSPLGIVHSVSRHRRDPRINIVPMDVPRRAARFTNRHGFIIGWTIAAVAAVVFCGPIGG